MEFTLSYTFYFINGIILAWPALATMGLAVVVLGLIVGVLESWPRFDSIYWSFITATTVGYGDIRPLRTSSRVLAIVIALQGMVLTGIVVALAISAATLTFSELHQGASVETMMEQMDRPSLKKALE